MQYSNLPLADVLAVQTVPSFVKASDASGLTDGSGSHHWSVLRSVRSMKGVSLNAQSSIYGRSGKWLTLPANTQ
jgi:hypothetical protein